jgi:general secretion pathway protein C
MTPLSPSQIRTGLDVLTGLVVISVGVALAGLTWRIAGHAGTGAITVPSGTRPVAIADVSPALALSPFGKAAVGDASQQTALPLVLKGVIFAVPASLSTAFIATEQDGARAFRVGESVGGASIEGIARDRVLLSNNGRIEYLTYPAPVIAGQPVVAPGSTPGPLTGAPIAPGSAPPPPPRVTPASLIARLDATPVAGGGYRIGENAPPGLRPGDMIQSVDGVPAGNQAALAGAVSAAQARGTVQIQILRDGKPVTLTVPTR